MECVCGEPVTLDSPMTGSGRDLCPALLSCPRAKSCGGFPLQAEDRVSNAMELLIRSVISVLCHSSVNILLIRSHVTKYYAGWLVCEDPGCSGRTRVMPLRFQRAYPVCPVCRVSSMYQVRGGGDQEHVHHVHHEVLMSIKMSIIMPLVHRVNLI